MDQQFETRLDYTEVFTISSSGMLKACPQVKEPINIIGGTGGMIRSNKDDSYTPLICGGDVEGVAKQNYCYSLLGNPVPVGELMHERFGAASIVVNNGTALWVTGGYDHKTTWDQSGTELIQLDNSGSGSTFLTSPSWPLPQAMSFHCIQKLDGGNKAIIYGGESFGKYVPLLSDAWIINLKADNDESTWTKVASMSAARKEHICGVLKVGMAEIVVAAGGTWKFDYTELILDIVEMLRIEDGSPAGDWNTGPKLPVPLFGAGGATTEDQTRLFVAGGTISFMPEENSRDVYSLHCEGILDCEWTKSELELWDSRASSVLLILPSLSRLDDILYSSNET